MKVRTGDMIPSIILAALLLLLSNAGQFSSLVLQRSKQCMEVTRIGSHLGLQGR